LQKQWGYALLGEISSMRHSRIRDWQDKEIAIARLKLLAERREQLEALLPPPNKFYS